MMKVDVITRETIKPSSPTPLHLQTFKLSLIDQCCPPDHTSLVLFYTATGDDDDDVTCRLKESLSDVLTRFYPLAGRINPNNSSVESNDAGVEYIEARASCCTIKDLLRQPDQKLFRALVGQPHLPDQSLINQMPLLIVQTTTFACGGMALGFSISHKVADGATIGTFINAYAATACAKSSAAAAPDLTAISSFLEPFPEIKPDYPNVEISAVDGIPGRYVFDASSIATLKAKAASESVPVPTRFEAVSALIWKCLILANPTSSSGSAVNWSINVRSYVEPPLPEHTFGNMFVFLPIVIMWGEKQQQEQPKLVELSELVGMMRKKIEEFRNDFVKKLAGYKGKEEYLKMNMRLIHLICRQDVCVYFHGSWCRFPFYQADFGWGKPAWVTDVPMTCSPDMVRFLDTRDGDGIEVHVNFADEDQLAMFESNPDLVSHAAFNPSVL